MRCGERQCVSAGVCAPVAADEDDHDHLDEIEGAVVDGQAALPPLEHAARADEADELDQPEEADRPQPDELRQVLRRRGGACDGRGGGCGRAFRTFSDVFGRFRTFSDVFGIFRIFGRFRPFWDVFGRFGTFWGVWNGFADAFGRQKPHFTTSNFGCNH